MASRPNERDTLQPRWRYLVLAASILIVAAVLMAGLWQVPQLFPHWFGASPAATPTAGVPTATATPRVLEPTIEELIAEADDAAGIISFQVEAEVPAHRQIRRVLLWYDTEAGRQPLQVNGPLASRTTIRRRLDAAHEGLTGTLTTTGALDYWWLIEDTAGEWIRAGGSVALGPNLQSLVVPQAAEAPPIDFTWGVSETEHFGLHYGPGRAAERDRAQIGALAEGSLDWIASTLDMDFDEQMSIYFVPRVFWQGGAAYGDKVQLISYLDRNYTGIEIWSYFTHEGTHALAQDLLEPKENGGGPDGVLVEGLAVWASHGHYRIEPIDAWAAVIASSEDYLPLDDLRAGPFYDFQHETSYQEAGSFVKYLVENYGLESFKELYGRAVGDEASDDRLVRALYGKGYDELEAEWLAYLGGLKPRPEQAQTWALKVRSFDLMRRYQTELDPDARILPGSPPPEWTSDTLRIFTQRMVAPANVVLETAFIAVQERLNGGDPEGASNLLDDIEAALDTGGQFTSLSLRAREEIVALVSRQDRAVLRADLEAYVDTLDPSSALAGDEAIEEALHPPYTAFRQEVVRLDLTGDGDAANGEVLVHARVADGGSASDGQLRAVEFVRTVQGWRMAGRQPEEVVLSLPAVRGD